jgi:hypothetical protein
MGFTPKVFWLYNNTKKKGELYTSKDCKHAKHGVAYVFKGRKSMLQLLVDGLMGEECKTFV